IKLSSSKDFTNYTLRKTAVLAQSEQLELAELPITDVVKGNRLVLDKPYLGLTVGRPVVVTGVRTDLDGVTDSEVMTLAEVTFNKGYTELVFVGSLANEYERASVTVNANVALATHGETKDQALGSGDANKPFQKFRLPEAPLTYVAAENTTGAASTLQVRINQLLWQEVDFLYGRGPDEHVYITRTDDEGRTYVQFGDGRTGARVPTGQENVRATYRKGMGAEGLVDEAQLTLLLVKPLGVRSVTNPLAAGDAADAESRDDVRRNAALPIRTLDRIVSLRDYEDFARAFSGVAKALATWTWNGRQRGVFVTVAGAGGKAIAEGSLTYKNLLSAMLQAGDPTVPLRVKSYTPAFFRLAGNLSIDPVYQTDQVLAAVEAALRAAFSFDAREFGQPVAKSEVIATIQAVKGVLAVDLNALHRTDATTEQLAHTTLFDRLTAQVPRAGTDVTVAAELLLLDPRPVQLGVMKA
ncbi:MAG TPA: putative baseplate assembly protein, partial [Rhodanobacter sp.]|nr:putative baseplate assembly protein [Rhodanobacter sp.]